MQTAFAQLLWEIDVDLPLGQRICATGCCTNYGVS